MKKICAFIVSVIVAAAVLTACGNGDSSSSKAESISSAVSAESTAESTADSTPESKAEEPKESEPEPVESKADESKADESKLEESKAEAPKGDKSGWGPLAKEYTEKLAGGVYTIDMTVKSNLTGEMPMQVEVNGQNAHLKTKTMGIEMEVYLVDGKTYSLMPSMNAYTVTDNSSLADQNINTYALADNAQLTESGEEDGMKTETYKIPVNSSGNTSLNLDTTVKYYFDADGNLKKILSSAPILGDTTVDINSVTFEDVNISLPDLSGMTKLEQNGQGQVDPKDAVKMTMSLLGISEDMVTKAGYTVEQLAGMETDKMAEVLADIAKKNGVE